MDEADIDRMLVSGVIDENRANELRGKLRLPPKRMAPVASSSRPSGEPRKHVSPIKPRELPCIARPVDEQVLEKFDVVGNILGGEKRPRRESQKDLEKPSPKKKEDDFDDFVRNAEERMLRLLGTEQTPDDPPSDLQSKDAEESQSTPPPSGFDVRDEEDSSDQIPSAESRPSNLEPPLDTAAPQDAFDRLSTPSYERRPPSGLPSSPVQDPPRSSRLPPEEDMEGFRPVPSNESLPRENIREQSLPDSSTDRNSRFENMRDKAAAPEPTAPLQKHRCIICDIEVGSLENLENHSSSVLHKINVEQLTVKARAQKLNSCRYLLELLAENKTITLDTLLEMNAFNINDEDEADVAKLILKVLTDELFAYRVRIMPPKVKEALRQIGVLGLDHAN